VKIIKKCLNKNRAKRYTNATELIRDINKFLPLHVQSNDNKLISDFVKHYEKIEQTATIHSNLYKSVKPAATWISIIVLILLFFFALFNINRFFDGERFSNLTIESNSKQFSVTIDGNSLNSSTTGQLKITNILPGNHELEVRGDDKYGINSSNIYLNPAEEKYQKVLLPEKNNTVNLSISTIPSESNVYINDRFIGKSPIDKLTLTSGKQNINIQKDGFHDLIIHKEFLSEQSYALQYTLSRKSE